MHVARTHYIYPKQQNNIYRPSKSITSIASIVDTISMVIFYSSAMFGPDFFDFGLNDMDSFDHSHSRIFAINLLSPLIYVIINNCYYYYYCFALAVWAKLVAWRQLHVFDNHLVLPGVCLMHIADLIMMMWFHWKLL